MPPRPFRSSRNALGVSLDLLTAASWMSRNAYLNGLLSQTTSVVKRILDTPDPTLRKVALGVSRELEVNEEDVWSKLRSIPPINNWERALARMAIDTRIIARTVLWETNPRGLKGLISTGSVRQLLDNNLYSAESVGVKAAAVELPWRARDAAGREVTPDEQAAFEAIWILGEYDKAYQLFQ